jgi:hypothetical protein
LKDKTQNWKKEKGRKISTCEESMQGVHAGKTNHIRARVFVGYCIGDELKN